MRTFRVEEESEEVAAHVLVVRIAADLHERLRPFDTTRDLPELI
jgi:hypothetical protein